jgi:hypothetical protein
VNWRLPFGRDRRFVREGAPAKIIGGFSVNVIAQAQSGFPISISAANASLQGLAFNSLRPIPHCPLPTPHSPFPIFLSYIFLSGWSGVVETVIKTRLRRMIHPLPHRRISI